jgi:hypothetical protein
LSWEDERGCPVATPRRDEASIGPECEKDIVIIRLRAARRSWRRIGPVVGMSHEGARRRYLDIPEAVREHFRRVALG